MKTKIVIEIALFLLLLVIVLQNTQVVTLQFFFWEASISKIVLILLTLGIGFVIGYFASKLTSSPSRAKEKGE